MAHLQALKGGTWDVESLNAFEPIVAACPFGGLQSVGEILHGCGCFHWSKDGQEALLALRLDQWRAGRTLHVMGAVSVGEHPLQTRQVMAAVEHTGRLLGADVLTLCTPHAAIAKSAGRWGGQITGAIIAKRLRALQ